MRIATAILLLILAVASCGDRPADVKVLLIIHNPYIETAGTTLIKLLHWHNPDSLAQVCIQDLAEVSAGYARFRIVERVEVDEYPLKEDGFVYTDDTFMHCWHNRSSCHQPDMVDYPALIRRFHMSEKVNSGQIDEVWLFGFPFGGYYESIMVGPGAVYCNAPPLSMPECKRLFVIMGFNYERGVGEMLEDFGHRTESIMTHVFGGWNQDESTDWNKFTLYDKVAPGRAQCGNVHFAPNSLKDYDWANKTVVESACDDWLRYPDLTGKKREVDCREWGCEIRSHHKWWFNHLPRAQGKKNGIWNNWWKYIVHFSAALKS
jgi:hypothetical protein